MAIIRKRADELKPGDVIAGFRGATVGCPAVVLRAWALGQVLVFDCTGNEQRPFIGYASLVDVEAPAFTPAQQHAEELVELLRDVRARAVDPQQLIPQRIDALLDKIKPPEPPTLEETLESLRLIHDCNGVGAELYAEYDAKAKEILDRARRSGVMK